jgi:hypothetical protein
MLIKNEFVNDAPKGRIAKTFAEDCYYKSTFAHTNSPTGENPIAVNNNNNNNTYTMVHCSLLHFLAAYPRERIASI